MKESAKSDEEQASSLISVFFEILGTAAYFCSLAILLTVWSHERTGWSWIIHLLVSISILSAILSVIFSGRRLRFPFSFPGIMIIMLLLFGIVNFVLAPLKVAPLQNIFFLLDGFFLFYTGTILFARRAEGFILLLILFIVGIFLFSQMSEQPDVFFPQRSATALYRGEKVALSTIGDYPLTGCGAGVLSELFYRYLPAPGRYPPAFSSGYSIMAAEWGLTGIILWILFLAVAGFSLYQRRYGREYPVKAGSYVFWPGMAIGGIILISGFFTPVMKNAILYFLLFPIIGTVMILAGDKSRNTLAAYSRRTSLWITGLAGLLLFSILLLEAAPSVSRMLIRINHISELGTPAYGRKVSWAQRFSPRDHQVHLALAKHLRALPPEKARSMAFFIEAAYLRATSDDPFDETVYLEYAHFLDRAGEDTDLYHLLRKAREFCPGSPEIRLYLFRVYMEKGERKRALDELISLYDFFPLDYSTQLKIAGNFMEGGSPRSAQEAFSLARQLSPLFRTAYKSDKDT